MAEAWVYADESGDPQKTRTLLPGKSFRVGSFEFPREIDNDVIDAALIALRERHPEDRAVLRGSFHASDDSPAARHAFSDAIRLSNFKLQIHVIRWRLEFETTLRTERRRHELVAMLNTNWVLERDYDVVHLRIEARQSTLDKKTQASWVKNQFDERLASAVRQGGGNIPIRFPVVELELVDKKNPGAQICDLLLWSIQRAEDHSDKSYMERLGLRPLTSIEVKDRPLMSASYLMGCTNPLEAGRFCKYASAEAEALPFETAVLEIEHRLRLAADQRRLDRFPHLAPLVREAAAALDIPALNAERLVGVARAFLLICDTFPVYERGDAEACRTANRLRSTAAVAAQPSGIGGVRARDMWFAARAPTT